MKKSIIGSLTRICCLFVVILLVIFSLLVESKSLLIYVVILILPLSALAGYTMLYIRRTVVKPIRYLMEEAQFISNGDLSQKISYDGENEISEFVSSFDAMRQTLYEQQCQQSQFEIERKSFIDSISHDLKTPLASISAYLEALQDGLVSTPEEEQQYLKVIENKVGILTELSNQLSLSYESPETLPLLVQKVNCSAWVSDFFADMELECQMKDVKPRLINRITSVDAYMLTDALQFDRALQNIINNAFRYYNAVFEVQAEATAGTFMLTIKNDGVKLQHEQTQEIFERFYTEEGANETGHLGLGLYISKTIIQGLNGELTAAVADGIICFTIRLPLVE